MDQELSNVLSRKILIRKLITDFKAKKEVHPNKLNILEAILMSNSALE
jgi:hypothetical protein